MKKSILPPRVFQLALALIILLHLFFPLYVMYESLLRYVGIVFILFGTYLNIYTDYLFKKEQTTIKPFEQPDTFILSGPFRYSRNPIYLGMLMILLGACIISGALSPCFVLPFFIGIIQKYYIVPEEQNMYAKFGNAYTDYRKSVRAWL